MNKYTHIVEFFDSMTMKNRVEKCRIVCMFLSDSKDEDMATVEVDIPIRKRLRVPIWCLTDLYNGDKLPMYENEINVV